MPLPLIDAVPQLIAGLASYARSKQPSRKEHAVQRSAVKCHAMQTRRLCRHSTDDHYYKQPLATVPLVKRCQPLFFFNWYIFSVYWLFSLSRRRVRFRLFQTDATVHNRIDKLFNPAVVLLCPNVPVHGGDARLEQPLRHRLPKHAGRRLIALAVELALQVPFFGGRLVTDPR